ncbi:hypothetical protein F511_40816 [Dorcoceras hygrometricum]|uniref:Uncharacterized protein n=1 Tax=Dorcoceras hygrometricum TaxID=472368 RepID=A0A2Z7AFH8_9LAMI|nr:hypothetical protein F511_40816 [Dorcoceras hygrometricum]
MSDIIIVPTSDCLQLLINSSLQLFSSAFSFWSHLASAVGSSDFTTEPMSTAGLHVRKSDHAGFHLVQLLQLIHLRAPAGSATPADPKTLQLNILCHVQISSYRSDFFYFSLHIQTLLLADSSHQISYSSSRQISSRFHSLAILISQVLFQLICVKPARRAAGNPDQLAEPLVQLHADLSSLSKGKCSNICSDELIDCERSVDAMISRADEAKP